MKRYGRNITFMKHYSIQNRSRKCTHAVGTAERVYFVETAPGMFTEMVDEVNIRWEKGIMTLTINGETYEFKGGVKACEDMIPDVLNLPDTVMAKFRARRKQQLETR